MANLFQSVARRMSKPQRKQLLSRQNSTIIPENPQRILWIWLTPNIGDAVMSLPALHDLRNAFPDATIDVLISKSIVPIIESQQLADNFIGTEHISHPKNASLFKKCSSFFSTWKQIKSFQGKYNLAIDMYGNDLARMIAFYSKIPYRLGFYHHPLSMSLRLDKECSYLMTHMVREPLKPHRHIILAYADVLQVMKVEQNPFEWKITPEQINEAAQLLKDLEIDGEFVVIHACSNESRRSWSVTQCTLVADRLISKYGLKVLLTGGKSDSAYNDKIVGNSSNPSAIYNVAGALSIMGLFALLKKARLMASVDTGPMHMGAMVRTPIVALMLEKCAPYHYPWRQPDSVVIAKKRRYEQYRNRSDIPQN